MKSLSFLPVPLILWATFIGSFTAYLSCIKSFSETLRVENPLLWDELRGLQDETKRVNPGRILFSFLQKGKFQNLNNKRISRAAFWVGISGLFAGVSGSVVFDYYELYLPYQR